MTARFYDEDGRRRIGIIDAQSLPSSRTPPELILKPRRPAHSDIFVLPRITMPTWRSLSMTDDSWTGLDPSRAKEPADASRPPSFAAMLSLTRIGIPWSALAIHPVNETS